MPISQRIETIRKIIADMPDARGTILSDLEDGRRGWYHNLILSYADDTDEDTWRFVAKTIISEQL